MGLRINTNVQSLVAQNKLSQTSKKLSGTLERLSTGLRINRGADDVVGLLKSESLRGQIRGIATAEQSISTAVNVLGVAEGSLNQLTEIAQSLREKVVQAADASLSAADRANLTTAVSDLLNGFTQIAQNTSFDGVSLLDGTFISKTFQSGPNANDNLTVSISDSRASAIGQVALLTAVSVLTTVSGSSTTLTDAGTFTINGIGISLNADGVSNAESDESALAYATAINAVSGSTGVTAQVLANVYTATYTSSNAIDSTATVYLNGVALSQASYGATDSGASAFVTAVNNISTQTGVSASLDSANDKIVLTASDGRNIDLLISSHDSTDTSELGFTTNTSGTSSASIMRGKLKLVSDSAFTLVDSATIIGSSATVGITTSGTTLSNLSVSSSSNAQTGINIMDNVIRQLQSRRTEIGSKTNRFESALKELAARKENLSQAESTIRNADVAKETADLTALQVLQQAGVQVLSKANGLPEVALTLLRG